MLGIYFIGDQFASAANLNPRSNICRQDWNLSERHSRESILRVGLHICLTRVEDCGSDKVHNRKH
jgi:hypothetical protein